MSATLRDCLALHRAGRLGEAEAGYRECLRRGERASGLPLAALLLQQSRDGDAIEVLEPLVREAPGNAELAVNLSVALRRSGRVEESVGHARRACELAPRSVPGWNALGLAELELGRAEAALAAFDAGLRVVPGHPALGLHRAHALRRLRRHAEAMQAYRQSLDERPDLLEAWRGLADVQAALGQVDHALRSRERAQALAPRDHGVALELAVALLQAGDAAQAAGRLELAVRSDGSDAQAWAWLGRARLRLGDLQAARAAFEQARSHDARDPVIAHFHAALSGTLPEAVEVDYIRSLFDDFADRFEQTLVGRLRYDTPAALARLLRAHGADAGTEVLDLGCGTGLLAEQLARPGRCIDGVDLSPRMLDHARAKGRYRELHAAELVEFLSGAKSQWDLIVATDVFIYVADLAPVFAAVAARLARGGWFAFSIECSAGDRTELLPATGRYRQAPARAVEQLGAAGFTDIRRESVILRLELERPVAGELVLARLPDAT